MIAKRVHHISFTVSDLARSRRFYEEVLGLTEIPRPDFGIPGVWYAAGENEVHLIATPEKADAERPQGPLTPLANHQAFAIDDYEKVLRMLEGRGIEVMQTSPEAGQMWIRDPDGNVIELIRPPA